MVNEDANIVQTDSEFHQTHIFRSLFIQKVIFTPFADPFAKEDRMDEDSQRGCNQAKQSNTEEQANRLKPTAFVESDPDFLLQYSHQSYIHNHIKQMGPIVLIIDIAVIVTSAISLGETIAVEVLQQQIRSKIKEHQKQFDALKDLKIYLQSLLKEDDINQQQQFQTQDIYQNINEVEAFLQNTKKNLVTLVNSYPQQLVGQIVPTDEYTKKLLATFKSGDNLQTTKYFLNKAINSKGTPPFTVGALNIVDRLDGIDWENLGKLLLAPGLTALSLGFNIFSLKSFLDAGKVISKGIVFGSVLSAIGLAYNIYSIINNASEIKKLVDQKDQIYKEIALLPKTQVDALDVVKGSLSSFLAYLVVAGNLISRIREKYQFVSVLTTDQQIKNQLKAYLQNIPGPHQLIPLETIRKTNNYASQLQTLFKGGVNQGNAKEKIIGCDDIFRNFFREVRVSELHEKIKNIFTSNLPLAKMVNDQFQKMKKITDFLGFVINALSMSNATDNQIDLVIKSHYKVSFSKDVLNNDDNLIIAKCLASVRSKFYGDDESGLTYLGYRLADYHSNASNYANAGKINTNEEDITQYEADWFDQYSPAIIKALSYTFPKQTQFRYYKSVLNYGNATNTITEAQLLVTKFMFFKGQFNLYKVQCGLEEYPQMTSSIYTGQSLNSIKIPSSQTLRRGMKLLKNEYLISQNGEYYAVMQQDGNFVVSKGLPGPQNIAWSSNTHRQNSSYTLIMQYDGHLVIYNQAGTVIWASNTWRADNPTYHLSLSNQGILTIADQDNHSVWSSTNGKFSNWILSCGSGLRNGEFLKSQNGYFIGIMQEDGNFVVYRGMSGSQSAIWATGTSRSISSYELIMQTDGNLVIYDQQQKTPIWSSNTWRPVVSNFKLQLLDQGDLAIADEKNQGIWTAFGQLSTLIYGSSLRSGEFLRSQNGDYIAIMQIDGNFVVYKGGAMSGPQNAIWSTKTSRNDSDYEIIMQTDGNLVIYDKQQKIPIWATNTIAQPNVLSHLKLLENGQLTILDQNSQVLWQN